MGTLCSAGKLFSVLLLPFTKVHGNNNTSLQRIIIIYAIILYTRTQTCSSGFVTSGGGGGDNNRVYIARPTWKTNKRQRFAQHTAAQSGLEWSLFYLPVPKRLPVAASGVPLPLGIAWVLCIRI